jgi:uncharacterized protein (TIGR03663 family)
MNGSPSPNPRSRPSRGQTFLFCAAALSVLAMAALFRLPLLDERPLHGDEANQAHRTGKLLETGEYRYDPRDHHGPTLYFLAAPVLRMAGVRRFADSAARHYRVVPAVGGILLVAATLLLARAVGGTAALIAALLVAVSPAFTYYSRFFIQETLLVLFTAAAGWCLWTWCQNPRSLLRAAATGLFLGLMFATKETAVLAYAAAGAGLVVALLPGKEIAALLRRPPLKAAVVCAFSALVVSALLFSSFGTHPAGVTDSVRAFGEYLSRAAGDSARSDGAAWHVHPWHFYLSMLAWTRRAPGPWWSEGLILAGATLGLVTIFFARGGGLRARTARFIAVYTLALVFVYSAIPYKTPWCAIGFLHGMALLSGIGFQALLRAPRPTWMRIAAACVLTAGVLHLGMQAVRTNTTYAADRRNPYAYAHTADAITRLEDRMEALAAVHPDGHAMLVRVIVPSGDYWPLPWYLRKFSRVGYWSGLPEQADADVIISAPEVGQALQGILTGDYMTEHHGLRPGVLMQVRIKRTLWDTFMADRQ